MLHFGSLSLWTMILSWICLEAKENSKMEEIKFHYNQGYRHSEEGSVDKAIQSYLRVLELNDHESSSIDANAYFSLAGLYRSKDQLEEAIRCSHETIRADPFHAHAHGFLANTYELKKDLELAISHHRKAVELEPQNANSVFYLAKALEKSGDMESAIRYYREAIHLLREQKVPVNARMTPRSRTLRWAYYIHSLGHALQSQGKQNEAVAVYQEGVTLGIWTNPYQRFIQPRQHIFPEQKPWYDKEDAKYPTEVAHLLESNFEKIREEAIQLAENPSANFELEPERLHDRGLWNVMEFINDDGTWHTENCQSAPFTCQVISEISNNECLRKAKFDSCFSTTDCDSFFSRLKPGTHITPHCGPTNFRLRLHLGIKIPQGVSIRVADETRTWEEGKVIVFDDSFEHEVWHNGTEDRIILCVDIWHPEVPEELRK